MSMRYNQNPVLFVLGQLPQTCPGSCSADALAKFMGSMGIDAESIAAKAKEFISSPTPPPQPQPQPVMEDVAAPTLRQRAAKKVVKLG